VTRLSIVFLTSSDTASGGARQAMYLARELTRRGHRLRFLTPRKSRLPGLEPGVEWLRLPASRSAWAAAVRDALPRPGPAVVHAFHNRAVKLAAWRGWAWRRHGAAVFAHRGVIFRPNNPLPYWLPSIDAFLVNSSACADTLRRIGVARRRLRVAPNAIPAERLQSVRQPGEVRRGLDVAPGDLLFGAVAGNKPVKGVDPLLRAFAKAVQTSALDARLVVVGVDPALWEPLCRDLGVAERVRLVAHTDAVADYLRAMDCFVLPSLSESMPNTLLEAICAGLPVVASAVGGVPEVVADNGLLAPPGDVAFLAQALVEASDRSNLERWAAASRGLAPAYSMRAKGELVESIYLETLKRRGLI
jgi:glycosyltransferase involved in cell wall biosynthesis